MTTEEIINLILILAPSVLAILTMIATVWRVVKEFLKVKNVVTEMRSNTEISDKLSQVLQENYELKKTIKELLTKIDHVERK